VTLEELLKGDRSSYENMEKYFSTIGISHVKKKDLDKIIDRFGLVVFKLSCFSETWRLLKNEKEDKCAIVCNFSFRFDNYWLLIHAKGQYKTK